MNVRRIRRLRIDGFGHFRDCDWEIHPGLHLFIGRNEAGKSTLLAFVRGVLFGFEPRSSARRYEPFSGGPFGGAVWMEDGEGRCVHIRRNGQERAAGRLAVALPDGGTAEEDWLRQWLGGIDKTTFRQVFAFGLDDLQQVRWLKDEALTPFLYHTLAGGGSWQAVRKNLLERETALFRPRGHAGPIHDLLRELEDLQGQCRRLRQQQHDVEHLRLRLADLDRDADALEQEIGKLQEELEQLEQLGRFVEPYRRLASLAAALNAASRTGDPADKAAGQDEGGGDGAVTVDWQRLREAEEGRLAALRRSLESVAAEKEKLESQAGFSPEEMLFAPETAPLRRRSRSVRDKEADRPFSAAFPAAVAALGLALAGGWGLWVLLWRGELSPALWVPAAVFLLAGVGGAVAARKAARKRRDRRRQLQKLLAVEHWRWRQEEDRLLQEMEACQRRLADLREAETLAAVLGPWRTNPLFRQRLAVWAERSDAARAAEQQRLESVLAERLRQYAAGLEERGRLMEQIEGERRKGEELAELERRLHERQAQLQRLARRWSAAVLARHALEEALAAYERERQPETIKRASDYFSQLTGGRYRRVLAPWGERELLAERADGERLLPVHLSRGTVEQLLLAMRLALADEYNDRVVLPLMMDDIFVNFDDERLHLAVETLRSLAGRRQIVFMTCHPHVDAAFRRVLAGDDWGYDVLDGRST